MTRGRVVLLVLAGAALVLVASMLVWLTGRAEDVAGSTETTVTGARVARGLVPLALAAGAGGFALTLVDGWGRRVVALVVTACGLAVGWASVQVAIHPPTTVTQTGATGPSATETLSGLAVSPAGPGVALLGALMVVAGGVLALVRGDRRPHRAARRSIGPRTEVRRSEWDRLSDGEDPT